MKQVHKQCSHSHSCQGNGLCSLAELETWVLSELMKAYPKDSATKAEPGRDLFDLFRPCFIRAFNDAKDYKADSGKVIEGTKSATNDDFVSKGEFRLFSAYACIYAAMVSAAPDVVERALCSCTPKPTPCRLYSLFASFACRTVRRV
jgi:hypothetical protein